jgi:cyclase
MPTTRLIARLDVKPPNLIKGINLEGVRVVGEPHTYALKYYSCGIDEIIYMDAVATLYGRNSLAALVSATANDVFIPMTVGGGIKSLKDVEMMLRAGADKVAINTAAIQNPQLITDVAQRFGSQCMVLSVEAKKTPQGWEAYTDLGREKTGRDVLAWVSEAVDRGAGEILLTSVDHEGMCKGFDVALTSAVATSVRIPVIASGGMGHTQHLIDVVQKGHADAAAMAHVLHFNKVSLADMRTALNGASISVREAA